MEIQSERIVVQEAIPAITKEQYVMTIDQDEARFLCDIMDKIGGDPDVTRRRHCDAFAKALDGAGVSSNYPYVSDLSGHMCFRREVGK